MIKRYTIRRRIWITIWFTSVFSAVLFVLLTFYLYDRFYLQTQEDLLLNRGEKLINIYESEGLSGAFYDGMTYTNELTESKVFFIDFLKKNPAGLRFLTNADIEQLRNGETVVSSRTHPIEGTDILMTGFPIIENNRLVGTLILYLELGQISEPFRPLRLMIFFMIGLIVLNLVIFGRQIIDTIIRPLIDMKRASTVYAQGDFAYRIPIQSDDEIGELVTEYNKMVHQLEQSAQALAKSEREGAWREMARQVAHEIKNPLTPMKLSIQYLQKAIVNNQPNVKELTASVANTLVEQIDHLSRIAADFARFANIGNRNNEVFDLHPVLDSLYSLYGANPKVLLQWRKIPEPLTINADKTQMNRLFSNLLSNAVDACTGQENCIIQLQEEWQEEDVLIKITDNGEGIPLEMQPKIFTPNFTTKTSGTGLGLAMCYGIIRQEMDGVFR